jgi:hypothetical protein
MKQLFLMMILCLTFATTHAQTTNSHSTTTRGYTKKNGTYVAPAHKTTSNRTQRDNYTTKGNTNPYTGKQGTRTAKK